MPSSDSFFEPLFASTDAAGGEGMGRTRIQWKKNEKANWI
jgi:hypothetical protein